jgi:hypothetical protein
MKKSIKEALDELFDSTNYYFSKKDIEAAVEESLGHQHRTLIQSTFEVVWELLIQMSRMRTDPRNEDAARYATVMVSALTDYLTHDWNLEADEIEHHTHKNRITNFV